MMKACPAVYACKVWEFQMLPRPTAEPRVAAITPSLVVKVSRAAVCFIGTDPVLSAVAMFAIVSSLYRLCCLLTKTRRQFLHSRRYKELAARVFFTHGVLCLILAKFVSLGHWPLLWVGLCLRHGSQTRQIRTCIIIPTMPGATRNPRYSSLNNRSRQQADFEYIVAYYTLYERNIQPLLTSL